MLHRAYLFPLWIRLWHWVNAVLFLLLLISGLSLHYSNSGAAMLDFNLAQRVHNVCGILLALTYTVFVIGNIITGNWRQFLSDPKGYAGRAWRQTRFYLWDIFQGREAPFPATPDHHFNPMQQVVYFAIMYLAMPALLITGLIYLWPEFAPDTLFGVDGLVSVAMAHYIIAYGIILFAISHIYLGSCGKKVSTHYKSIIIGWHEE
jgi:thiosulfate reductase cytochrome b subunit